MCLNCGKEKPLRSLKSDYLGTHQATLTIATSYVSEDEH